MFASDPLPLLHFTDKYRTNTKTASEWVCGIYTAALSLGQTCSIRASHRWCVGMCVKWLIYMCEMAHSGFACATHWWCVGICVIWLIHMCDMTHSYVWHDSRLTLVMRWHLCHMTLLYVSHDLFISATWHDAFTSVTWPIHESVTWLIHLCDMIQSYVWHD